MRSRRAWRGRSGHRRFAAPQDGVRARLLKPIAQPNQPRIECLDSEPSHHERGRRVTAIPIMRSSISQTGMNQEAYLIYSMKIEQHPRQLPAAVDSDPPGLPYERRAGLAPGAGPRRPSPLVRGAESLVPTEPTIGRMTKNTRSVIWPVVRSNDRDSLVHHILTT
jgi:hypothetical protein